MSRPHTDTAITAATAADVLAAICGTIREPYDLPGNKRIWIKALTELEIQKWRAGLARDDDGTIVDPYGNAKLLVLCICDERGNCLFTETDQFKLAAGLGVKLRPLANLAAQINGLGAEEAESLAKNSEATRGNDS